MGHLNYCIILFISLFVVQPVWAAESVTTTVEEEMVTPTNTTSTLTSDSGDSFFLDKIGRRIKLGSNDPVTIASSLIDVGLGLLGIIFVFIILIAGLKWMTSGGKDEKIKEARKTLFNAIIGVILILSAYSIVTFIFRAFEDAGIEENL